MFICSDDDLADIQQLANTYYNEIRQRGTLESFDSIKRLLCLSDCDEFIFALVKKFEGGWVIDKASPLYRGNQGFTLLNKMPEKNISVEDLANYYLVNDSFITKISDTDNNGNAIDVINIDSANAISGIQQNGADDSFKMTIDPNLNYEISFFVKMAELGSILSFGVDAWDCDGNKITNGFERITSGTDTSYFFRKAEVIKQDTDYVQVRGFIYNHNEPQMINTDGQLCFGYGRHLRFKSNVVSIYPIITIEDGITVPSNSTSIYGVRVAVASNPYSLGFLGLANYMVAYFKNNNNNLSINDIREQIDRFLIPANATLSNIVEI